MAKMKVQKVAANRPEACELCLKKTGEVMVSLSTGTKYDQTNSIAFVHRSCLDLAIDKAVR